MYFPFRKSWMPKKIRFRMIRYSRLLKLSKQNDLRPQQGKAQEERIGEQEAVAYVIFCFHNLILLLRMSIFESYLPKCKVMKISSKIKIFSLVSALFWFSGFSALAQMATDRQPYAAGKFYTADSSQLVKNLAFLFGEAENHHPGKVLAVISPHAGYVYSGETAATAYKQLDPEKDYDNIFLIGSSHTLHFEGASVYAAGDYITPLGEVQVNRELAQQLIDKNKNISFVEQAHTTEHSLENQLPFLQYYLKKPFRIVPIIIGNSDTRQLKSIAKSLKPYLNNNNLFVISSDFSHYPLYRDAQKADSTTAKGILSNDPDTFQKAITEEHRHRNFRPDTVEKDQFD